MELKEAFSSFAYSWSLLFVELHFEIHFRLLKDEFAEEFLRVAATFSTVFLTLATECGSN